MWFIYLTLSILLLYIMVLAYMKIKFRFWSIQPVFHFYNLFDWLRPNTVILKELPEMNKYVNLFFIKTHNVNEMNDTQKTRFCNFIKSYYLRNKHIEYIPEQKHILEYLYASNHPAFISIYKQPTLLFEKETNIDFDEIQSVISARPLHVTINNKPSFPIYYVDNLCVNPAVRNKGIAPKSIQTLTYNLRHNNKKIKVFLFKREGEMTTIIPLCTYKTYGYTVNTLPLLKIPHSSIQLIEITAKNLQLAIDFMLKRQKFYSCVIVPEITNILNLIKVNNIILYGLMENQELISLYIYRDAATFYNKEKTMECIASLSACPFKDIFLAGFLISIQKSAKHFKSSKVLIENTSDNYLLHEYLIKNNIHTFLESPTAFFFYNFISYSIPSNKCFFLY